MASTQALAAMTVVTVALTVTAWSDVFARPDYNLLAKLLAVTMILWLVSAYARAVFPLKAVSVNGNEGELLAIPEWSKCVFGQPRCEKATFTVWTVLHFLMYIIIGYLVPGLYFEIFMISILVELLEHSFGYPAKFLLDPTVNMAGYVVGTALSRFRG